MLDMSNIADPNNPEQPERNRNTNYLEDALSTPISIITSNDIDLVAGRYQVQKDQPMPFLNGGFAKAYGCNDKNNPDSLLYALVFDNNFNPRVNLAEYLKRNAIERMIIPIEGEITHFSLDQIEHYIAILPFPSGITLREYLEKTGACSLNFVKKFLILPLTRVLQQLESVESVHGRINLDNIYINPTTNVIVVGECISETPFYSQKNIFCPLEIADCLPIARGMSNITADYFALGVIIFIMLSGNYQLAGINQELLFLLRMERSSFLAITNYKITYAEAKNLLKGLINDRVSDRWKSTQLLEWYNNQATTFITNNEGKESNRALLFNDKDYYSCHYLSYGLQKSWSLAKKFILDDKITKWIERAIGNGELSGSLERISILGRNDSITTLSPDYDALLIRYLMNLDIHGPLRMKDFSIVIESLPILILYGYISGKKEYLENIKKIFSGSYWRFFSSKSLDKKSNSFNKLVYQMDKIKELHDKDSLGFGMERCLYELNPFAPCYSEIFKDKIIMSLSDLLSELNIQISLGNQKMMDRHIAAFILSKLKISKEIVVAGMINYPFISKRKEIIGLAVLSMAQQNITIENTNPENISHLARACVVSLEPAIALLHNKHTRIEITEKLFECAKNNNLAKLLRTIADPDLIKKDIYDFEIARRLYRKTYLLHEQLVNGMRTYEIGYRYGLKLCVIISYLLCSITVIYLISNN